ncbi:MAG: isoprenylcysteine carboxylmethyltransferase family protein [Anaerolineales bacterium]|nr:isoprenylcysteine carboxylmethyltransferase family protein [Anaerolineales bacterium]
MIRGILILVVYHFSLLIILFTAAGRTDWLMGWLVLGIYALISFTSLFSLDRDLVDERVMMGGRGVSTFDRAVASLSFLFLFPLTLFVTGLDHGRYQWSPEFPYWLQGIGLLIFIAGNALGRWAMNSNEYFSTFLRIQDERDHAVVRTGPYKYIRHPGYAGAILAALALPIALGSLWALIPALIGAVGFVIRTLHEDRYLEAELDGYSEYARQVQFRLIPYVW